MALKTKLCTAPILASPDPKAALEMYTDASELAIAGVLLQRRKKVPGGGQAKFEVLEYYSKALTGAESRYNVSEREALAVVKSAERFRRLMIGRHVDTSRITRRCAR